jgi:hypothetical protein
MKYLPEINENIQVLLEATEEGKKNFFIEGVFLMSDIENRNKRIYPKDIMSLEVARFNEQVIGQNRALGELGHPATAQINLDLASHRIVSLREDGNNYIGKAKLLNTPRGKIAQEFVSEGVKLGVSSRGFGSLTESNGKRYVGKDFYLATVDIVFDPSAPDAFVNGIMESKEYYLNEGILMEKDMAALQKQVKSMTKTQINEGALIRLFDDFMKSLNNKA